MRNTRIFHKVKPWNERTRFNPGKRKPDLARLVSARAAGLHKEKIEKEKEKADQ